LSSAFKSVLCKFSHDVRPYFATICSLIVERNERTRTSGHGRSADAAVVQREVGNRLLERFDVMRIAPSVVLDVGCGPGTHTSALARRFPDATVIAVDQSPAMVARAAPVMSKPGWFARVTGAGKKVGKGETRGLVADMNALPLPREHADVLWSNFALHCANDLPALFAEWNRVLKVEGVMMFTAPGPDTLIELRRAISRDEAVADKHVHRFTDLHDLGDMLVHAGFADPVMDMEMITLEYATTDALWRDLKAQGARNSMQTRAQGLMTPRKLRAIAAALDAGRRDGGPIRISVEVIYGHAWKVAPKKTAEGHGIVRIESIGRGSRG
jgi:malonyl-CoA O-methyltransferase